MVLANTHANLQGKRGLANARGGSQNREPAHPARSPVKLLDTSLQTDDVTTAKPLQALFVFASLIAKWAHHPALAERRIDLVRAL
jgi:hypothetical protein